MPAARTCTGKTPYYPMNRPKLPCPDCALTRYVQVMVWLCQVRPYRARPWTGHGLVMPCQVQKLSGAATAPGRLVSGHCVHHVGNCLKIVCIRCAWAYVTPVRSAGCGAVCSAGCLRAAAGMFCDLCSLQSAKGGIEHHHQDEAGQHGNSAHIRVFAKTGLRN